MLTPEKLRELKKYLSLVDAAFSNGDGEIVVKNVRMWLESLHASLDLETIRVLLGGACESHRQTVRIDELKAELAEANTSANTLFIERNQLLAQITALQAHNTALVVERRAAVAEAEKCKALAVDFHDIAVRVVNRLAGIAGGEK